MSVSGSNKPHNIYNLDASSIEGGLFTSTKNVTLPDSNKTIQVYTKIPKGGKPSSFPLINIRVEGKRDRLYHIALNVFQKIISDDTSSASSTTPSLSEGSASPTPETPSTSGTDSPFFGATAESGTPTFAAHLPPISPITGFDTPPIRQPTLDPLLRNYGENIQLLQESALDVRVEVLQDLIKNHIKNPVDLNYFSAEILSPLFKGAEKEALVAALLNLNDSEVTQVLIFYHSLSPEDKILAARAFAPKATLALNELTEVFQSESNSGKIALHLMSLMSKFDTLEDRALIQDSLNSLRELDSLKLIEVRNKFYLFYPSAIDIFNIPGLPSAPSPYSYHINLDFYGFCEAAKVSITDEKAVDKLSDWARHLYHGKELEYMLTAIKRSYDLVMEAKEPVAPTAPPLEALDKTDSLKYHPNLLSAEGFADLASLSPVGRFTAIEKEVSSLHETNVGQLHKLTIFPLMKAALAKLYHHMRAANLEERWEATTKRLAKLDAYLKSPFYGTRWQSFDFAGQPAPITIFYHILKMDLPTQTSDFTKLLSRLGALKELTDDDVVTLQASFDAYMTFIATREVGREAAPPATIERLKNSNYLTEPQQRELAEILSPSPSPITATALKGFLRQSAIGFEALFPIIFKESIPAGDHRKALERTKRLITQIIPDQAEQSATLSKVQALYENFCRRNGLSQ